MAVVVFDTCVLIPLILRDILLDAALALVIEPFWSARTLEELESNLPDVGLSPQQASTLVDALKHAFPNSTIVTNPETENSLNVHPKDRHVLAAAIKSGASTILTFNLRDFPHSGTDPFNVAAMSPDEYLTTMLTPDQFQAMIRVVRDLASRYRRPPMSFSSILDSLEKQLPRFVDLMRRFES